MGKVFAMLLPRAGAACFRHARLSGAVFFTPSRPGLESALLVVVFVLLAFTAALAVVLAALLLRSVVRRRRRRRLKTRLQTMVEQAAASPYPSEALLSAFPGGDRVFSKRMLAALGEIYEEATGAHKHTARSLILRLGYGEYVRNHIKTGNTEKLVLLVRLVGELDLVGLDRRVASLLYVHRGNIDLQYQAYLTLSKLGSHDLIVRVCKDKDFVQMLSFRSLQEVLRAYTGDKAALYAALLHSPDPFVVRICVKRIGIEGFSSLAGEIFPFLESSDDSLVLDTARALGQLCYRPAAPHLARLLTHTRWETRAITVSALAQLDAPAYEDELAAALRDPEWPVRYNAARALACSPNIGRILQSTLDSGDRFAYEMLHYMVHATRVLEVVE